MPGTQGCGSGRMVLKVKLPKLHSETVPLEEMPDNLIQVLLHGIEPAQGTL